MRGERNGNRGDLDDAGGAAMERSRQIPLEKKGKKSGEKLCGVMGQWLGKRVENLGPE